MRIGTKLDRSKITRSQVAEMLVNGTEVSTWETEDVGLGE